MSVDVTLNLTTVARSSQSNLSAAENPSDMRVESLREKCIACGHNLLRRCCQFWSTRCARHIIYVAQDALLGVVIATPAVLTTGFIPIEQTRTIKFLLNEGVGLFTANAARAIAQCLTTNKTYQLWGAILGIGTGIAIATYSLNPFEVGSYAGTVICASLIGTVGLGAIDRIVHLRV